MNEKNDNYYPLSVFNSFSKDKFYQDFSMNNYMINKKGMFIPKKFDIFAFVFLFLFSIPLTILISGVSFLIVLSFSNNGEPANVIALLIIKCVSIILFMFSLYFSFVFSTEFSNNYDNSGLLSFLVKKKNTSYFGQEEYDLVKKNCPEELDKWVSAIIDYGETKGNEAEKYADNIVKVSKQKEKAVQTQNRKNSDDKWLNDRIASDALLDF